MDVEKAIRSRRTVKAFERGPVDRSALEELLELARWAPNHNLTNPWRFRVLGPHALAALKRAAVELALADAPPDADPATVGEAAAAKLDRAPTRAGWPPTGERRRCCEASPGARPSACRPTSASSACSTSGGRARPPTHPLARRPRTT